MKTQLRMFMLATTMVLGICQIASATMDLSAYSLSGTYNLPSTEASEASAVTYNWDTGTLFVIGDEGEYIVEVSKTGEMQSSMALTDFDDPEGLTYIGNDQFVVAEERIQDAFRLTYSAGTTTARSTLDTVSLGESVGNVGIEGISYDTVTGNYYTVKEKSLQEVNVSAIDFDAKTATVNSLFSPSLLGLTDLSDIQVLSILGLSDELLIVSQESQMLLAVDLQGNILSQYDLSDLVDSVEGVTVDTAGNIYLVAENGSAPLMYVLSASPVPLPGSLLLMTSGIIGLAGWVRRKKTA